jgi:hypothetical protein
MARISNLVELGFLMAKEISTSMISYSIVVNIAMGSCMELELGRLRMDRFGKYTHSQ